MNYSQTFRDSKGKPWTVVVTVASLKRAKAVANFDIDAEIPLPDAKPGGNKDLVAAEAVRPIQALLDDQIRFSNVLYAMLKPDVDKAGLSQDEFDESLVGDCVEDAKQSFIEGLQLFFPQYSPKRQILRGVVEARARQMKLMKRTQAKREQATDQAIQAMDREFQTAMTEADRVLDEASSKLASGSPAGAA